MEANQIVEEKEIQKILKQGKCPRCKHTGVIENIGPGEVGIGMPGTKLIPTMQWVDFLCRNCRKSFTIPKALYEKYK